MENEYKFVSKFIEGKTYQELTDEEIEKLKSGVGVKKEDKEYMEALENKTSEENQVENKETDNNLQKVENTETEQTDEEIEQENISEDVLTNSTNKEKKGVKVIRAVGRVLILEDKRMIELTKAELKEKAFWCKGDVYYG